MKKIVQIPMALSIMGIVVLFFIFFYSSDKSISFISFNTCGLSSAKECPAKCEVGKVFCSVLDPDYEPNLKGFTGIGPCYKDVCVEETSCKNYSEKECIFPKCKFFEDKCYKHIYEIENSKIIDGSGILKEVKSSIPSEAKFMQINKARSQYSNFQLMTSFTFYKNLNTFGTGFEHISQISSDGKYFTCQYGYPYEQTRLCPQGYSCADGASPNLIDGPYKGHCVKD